jgi:hypothetical protein
MRVRGACGRENSGIMLTAKTMLPAQDTRDRRIVLQKPTGSRLYGALETHFGGADEGDAVGGV